MVTGQFTIPPPSGIIYAPMDIARWISEGLVKKGHCVDFFAPEGSALNLCGIQGTEIKTLRNEAPGLPILQDKHVGGGEVGKLYNLWDQYFIAKMFAAAERGEYDLLHIHPVDRALPIAFSHPKIPVVYTLHDPIYPWRTEVYRMFASPNQYYVSISDSQRLPAPDINYAATIYNGIDLDLFPFSDTHENRFLFVGRIIPEKGVAEAVDAARAVGAGLDIIGPPASGTYWEERIKPYLGDQIRYIGYVPYPELHRYYQKAKALLVPIQWEEPFGLVMTEAMACGTPVIGFRRGSVSEVVKDGETGFIVDDVNGMAAAMRIVDGIDRHQCHRHVEEQFGIRTMIDAYERVFLDIINRAQKDVNA